MPRGPRPGLRCLHIRGAPRLLPLRHDRPVPAYAALRENEPVMFDAEIGYYVVSRYEDIKATFDNWQVFSSENAQARCEPVVPLRRRS